MSIGRYDEDGPDEDWGDRYDEDSDNPNRPLPNGTRFADPGGKSALRAACGEPNRLTPADRRAGYQCDACADALENGWDR